MKNFRDVGIVYRDSILESSRDLHPKGCNWCSIFFENLLWSVLVVSEGGLERGQRLTLTNHVTYSPILRISLSAGPKAANYSCSFQEHSSFDYTRTLVPSVLHCTLCRKNAMLNAHTLSSVFSSIIIGII
jgi:hypothetical protein